MEQSNQYQPFNTNASNPGLQTGVPPEDYQALSIVATLISFFTCFIPIGLISVLFSSSVKTKYYSGDIAGAMRASKNAKLSAILSIGLSMLAGILVIVSIILFVAFADLEEWDEGSTDREIRITEEIETPRSSYIDGKIQVSFGQR